MPRTKIYLFSILFLLVLANYSCSVSGDSSPETWVTFRVDMSNETASANGVHIAGTMESVNGSISAEHGIGLDKKEYLKNSRNKEEIELMKLLKKSIDPKNILNPGRIL